MNYLPFAPAFTAGGKTTALKSVFPITVFAVLGQQLEAERDLPPFVKCGRRVTRTDLDGSITIIADRYNGKKLNSPNDVAVASDGSIWFTDPIYGIGGNYEGIREQAEQEKHNVYRVERRIAHR
jgi:sugar lactone lactonase YvrE